MKRFNVALVCLVLWMTVGRAQETSARHPLQPSDTSSPAATLDSLIQACNELHQLVKAGAITEERAAEVLPTTERILACLDLSELPRELRQPAGIESALFLKEVLDRLQLPAVADIPGADQTADESAAPDRWQIPKTRIAVARVATGPYRNAYLFTPQTVRRAAEFFRMVKTLPYRSEGRAVSPGLRDAYIAATKRQPTQTANTFSPRGTITLFLDSCNDLYGAISRERHYDRSDPGFHRLAQQILSCLDTSQLPDYSREYFDAEAAVCLKEVLGPEQKGSGLFFFPRRLAILLACLEHHAPTKPAGWIMP